MDRSFLSDARVVEASRKFVCVRLATYEDESELPFLRGIFVGPGDLLQNSVFGILASDGKTKLTVGGRSPDWAFRDARIMAAGMKQIAEKHAPKKRVVARDLGLPYLKDVRLALNVAACDVQPVAVVFDPKEKRRARLEAALTDVAWSRAIRGRFLYARAAQADELGLGDRPPNPGLYLLAPDAFGRNPRLLGHVETTADRESITKVMLAASRKHVAKSKDSQAHIREAKRRGIEWKPATPVTDSHGRRGSGRRDSGRREPGRRRRR